MLGGVAHAAFDELLSSAYRGPPSLKIRRIRQRAHEIAQCMSPREIGPGLTHKNTRWCILRANRRASMRESTALQGGWHQVATVHALRFLLTKMVRIHLRKRYNVAGRSTVSGKR